MCSRWNVLKVVFEIGKFTIRDAILFHKFCIFNKEYFVFLAHRMFGCKSLFGVCLFFSAELIIILVYRVVLCLFKITSSIFYLAVIRYKN